MLVWVRKGTCGQQRTEKAGVGGVSRTSASGLGAMAELCPTGGPWCVMGGMELRQVVLAELFP